MRRRVVALPLAASLLLPAALLTSCQNPDNDKWLGAGIGAAAGAVAGRAIGGKKNRTGGTIIGAVVGGIAGYAIAGGFGGNASEEERSSPGFREANGEFDRGVEAKKSGDDAAALEHYSNATRLAPDQPEPYNNAGLIYLEQGDRVNAEASFRKALEVDPEFDPARTNLRNMGVAP